MRPGIRIKRNQPRNSDRWRTHCLFGLLVALFLTGCAPRRAPAPQAPAPPATLRPRAANPEPPGPPGSNRSPDVHLTLGNPSAATPDPANRRNYLIVREQYALSYDADAGIPNWVSWRLAESDLGRAERSQFRPDPDLPEGFYAVTPRDYSGSGYDRGHMCPSGDRSTSADYNLPTFFMTNIVPQAPGNNQGPWRLLEEACRSFARQGNELYIVAGPHGKIGAIADGRVRVPQNTWKAALILPDQEGDDLARVSPETRVIAVWMPNDESVREAPWEQFTVTVDTIEERTGLDLFSAVPSHVQEQLESRSAGGGAIRSPRRGSETRLRRPRKSSPKRESTRRPRRLERRRSR